MTASVAWRRAAPAAICSEAGASRGTSPSFVRAISWSSSAALNAARLPLTSASAVARSLRLVARAVATAPPAVDAAERAVSSFSLALETASTAVLSASRAVTASLRAWLTSVGCVWTSVLTVCRYASRAVAAADSAVRSWSSCVSVAPNGSQPRCR